MKKIYTLILLSFSISFSAQIEGTWKIAEIEGSLAVGPDSAITGQNYWQVDSTVISDRPCLFDDSLTFDNNGNFMHYMDGSTWLEPWQGVAEECGTPVSPFDGGSSTYTFANNQLTVNGLGKHIGVSKVYNGGECTSISDAQSSITYQISFDNSDSTFIADINVGANWWRFIYDRTSYVRTVAPPPPPVATFEVTFEVEVPDTVTVGTTIYGGGGALGDAMALELSTGGNGVWCGTHSFPAAGGNYIFLNSPSNGGDWGAKEDLNGLACSDPANYNDRLMPVLTSDTTLKLIFGSCDATTLSCTVGINEIDHNLSIYPNPSNGLLNINSTQKINTLRVYNMIGNLVMVKNIANNQSILDIENLTNGVYFMQLNLSDGSSLNSKFIKK